MASTQELKLAGFDDNEINDYVSQESINLREAGFSDEEIGTHFGPQPVEKTVLKAPTPEVSAPQEDIPKQFNLEGLAQEEVAPTPFLDLPEREKRIKSLSSELKGTSKNLGKLQFLPKDLGSSSKFINEKRLEIENIESKAIDNKLPADLYKKYTGLTEDYNKAVSAHNTATEKHAVTSKFKIDKYNKKVNELDYLLSVGEPISTITGKPVPTAEDKFAGGRDVIKLAPYAFASATRGMVPEALETAIMQPITKGLTGHDYVSPITKAQQISAPQSKAAQEAIGGISQMVGAVVPLNVAFKTADVALKSIGLSAKAMKGLPVLEQLTYHLMRGGTAGGIYGGISEGTPEAIGKDAALFAVLEGAFGTAAPIVKKISNSPWYRGLSIKERGLVTSKIAKQYREGMTEADVLRFLGKKSKTFKEALKARTAGEQAGTPIKADGTISGKFIPELTHAGVPVKIKPSMIGEQIVPPLTKIPPTAEPLKELPAGQGFELVPKTKLRKAPVPKPFTAEVEYKPIVMKSGKSYKTKGFANAALKRRGLNPDEYTVVDHKGGFAIQKSVREIESVDMKPTGKERILGAVKESREKAIEPRIISEGVYGSKRGKAFTNEALAKLNKSKIAKDLDTVPKDLTMVPVGNGFAWKKTIEPAPAEPKDIAREPVGVEAVLPEEVTKPSVGVEVNEQGLKDIIEPKSQASLIGKETGKFNKDGVSVFSQKSEMGESKRYVHAKDGKIVSGIQVMVTPSGEATITNAYTETELQRQGLATGLIEKAKVDYPDLVISEERSKAGQALVQKFEKPVPAPVTKPSAREAVKEQATIRMDLKTGRKVTVYKNPTDAQAQELRNRFKEEYPDAMRGTPKTRSSYDIDGNEYRWMADDATHSMVEGHIKKKFGIETNQNIDMLSAKPQPSKLPTPKPSEARIKELEGEGIGEAGTTKTKIKSIGETYKKEVPIDDYIATITSYVKKADNKNDRYPYKVYHFAEYSHSKDTYDNLYSSYKTLKDANKQIQYEKDSQADEAVKVPMVRDHGKKGDGFAETTVDIEVKKRNHKLSKHNDYVWEKERDPENAGKFRLVGRLKEVEVEPTPKAKKPKAIIPGVKPAKKVAEKIEVTKEDIESFIKPLHSKYYLEGQEKGIAVEKLNAYGAFQINKLVGSKLRACVDLDVVKQYLEKQSKKTDVESKVEVETTTEGKDISVGLTKKQESAITPKEQKAYLLAEIDKAIEGAPDVEIETITAPKSLKYVSRGSSEKSQKEKADYLEKVEARNKNHGMVTINVPDDGVFTILNTKETLGAFKKQAKKFPATMPEKKVAKPTKIRKPPLKESIGEVYKLTGDKEYFTDGGVLIKGKPPAKAKFKDRGPEQEMLVEMLNKETKPAKLKYYAFSTPDVGEGVSSTPIPSLLIDETNKGFVVFQTKDGTLQNYDQLKFNAIIKRYPKTTFGIAADGFLIAYEGKPPVAGVMPVDTEGIVMEEMAIKQGFLKGKKTDKGITLYSGLDPALLIDSIKKAKGQYQKAKPYIQEFGQRAYQKAKDHNGWVKEMKSYLKILWYKFKSHMKPLWSELKAINSKLGQRGALGEVKAKTGPASAVNYIKVLDRYEAKLKTAKNKLEKIKTSKEILKKRREFIRSARDHFNLTDAELKKISGRDIRLMSSIEFKKYIDGIEIKAEEYAEKRQKFNELDLVRKEKEFINENNIREFHKLPTIKEMTAKQLESYADILNSYEKGDQFLSPKRIFADEKTIWKGAKTIREVLEKAAKEFNEPIENLKQIKVDESDRIRYDTALARQHPVYDFMVDTIKTAEVKNQLLYFNERDKLYRLSKLALKSRKRGILGRLVPQQKEIMEYIESENKVEAAKKLTPTEINLAEGIEDFYRRAYNWLLVSQELKTSRFSDDRYVFHAKRPLSELLVDLPDTGIKSALNDLLRRWKLDEAQFKILDSKTGDILRMKKFFRQTLFRTGEMTPSKNIIKSTDIYMQQFFKKMAIDESVPTIETLVISLRPKETTKTGIFLDDSMNKFVKAYLNNKKGRTVNIGIPQGGKIDSAIRFTSNLITLRYIAGNAPLQIASIIGETTAKLISLGNRKLVLANARKLTPKGRRILKKYKYFTGEGVLEEIFQPARNIGENINTLLYGLFKWNRKITKQDIILGNMTKAEFTSETISDKKLAQMTKLVGRWVDIGGTESVLGSTSIGKSGTKFRQWAIPMISSTAQNAASLARTFTRLGDPKKRLTWSQAQEFYRIAEIGALVTAIMAAGVDEDKDTFVGKLKFYALRELSTVFQALSIRTILSFGVTVAFLEQLSKNLYLLMKLEKYKTKKGLKGVEGLKRQFTPALISQFKGEEKTKKTGRSGKKLSERFSKQRSDRKKKLSERFKRR